MAENSSGKRMSISFTLPISCQICLGKVKQPVVCPNHHVFCSSCIELWLQHNQQCPTCRIPITPENPCKQIIGGQNQDNEGDSHMSNAALRRARFDILFQDCENEIKRLQRDNETLRDTNCQLQEKLAGAEQALASNLGQTSDSSHACTSPWSSPSAAKLKIKTAKWGTDNTGSPQGPKGDGSGAAQDRGWGTDSLRDDAMDNGEMLAVLRSKLKQATSTYEKIKQDMDKLKEKNMNLSTDNRTLLMENGRLKQAAATRSPRKYEKYTSLAQQSKLDQSRREVTQLKCALERSDAYIEELETELGEYKSSFGTLPRKRPCQAKDAVDRVSKVSGSGETTAAKSDSFLTLGRQESEQSRRESHPTDASSTLADSIPSVFLSNNIRLFGGKETKASHEDPSTDCITTSNGEDFVLKIHKSPPRLEVLPDSDDSWDLEDPNPVRNTPSTALGRLCLDSSKKPASRLLGSSLGPGLNASPSCHRQLDFGKEPAKVTDRQLSLPPKETQGLLLEGNVVDAGPLDPNATFSDLNFTFTSEFSDCAQLMKEAEKRVKSKRPSSEEEPEVMRSSVRFSERKDENSSAQQEAVSSSFHQVTSGEERIKTFTSVTSSQDAILKYHTTYRDNGCLSTASYQDKLWLSGKLKGDADNTQVTWSKNRPIGPAFTEPQEPVLYMSKRSSLPSSLVSGRYHSRESLAGDPSYTSLSYSNTDCQLVSQPSKATAFTKVPTQTIGLQPTIKPALMKFNKLDAQVLAPERSASTNRTAQAVTSSGPAGHLVSDTCDERDDFSTTQKGPLSSRIGDHGSAAQAKRPGRQTDTEMAAYSLETKYSFPVPGWDLARQDRIDDSHKRIRLDQDSDDGSD